MSRLSKSTQLTISFLLLTLLSFLGNYFNIELFLGIHFIFGSIFILLIIHYFGVRLAVLAAIISSLYTVFLWDSPFGMISIVIETALVGTLYYKVKKNLILWEVIYFLVIGIPLCFLFSSVFDGHDTLNTTVIMLKQGINMLLNVTIANLLIILIETSKLVYIKRKISLQEILLNLMLAFFLIPVVCSLIILGKGELTETRQSIKSQIENTTQELVVNVTQSYQSSLTPLKGIASRIDILGLSQSDEIFTNLMHVQSSFPDYYAIYVSDKKGNVLHSYSGDAHTYYEYDFRDSMAKISDEKDGRYLSDLFKIKNTNINSVSITVPISTSEAKGYVVGIIKPSTYGFQLRKSVKERMVVTLVDRDDKIIESTDPDQKKTEKLKLYDSEIFFEEDDGLSLEESIATPQDWSKLSYSKITEIGGEIPWKIHVKVPVNFYANQLYDQFVQLFISAFLLSGVALLLSYFLSKWIQNSFTKVAGLTKDVPTKIAKNQKIEWPDIRITEISNIVGNFKKTESKLRSMFNEILQAKQELEFIAHYDQLTNLFNRAYLLKRFDELVKSGTTNKMAIIFIDLDRFKIVNDTLGHEAGDSLLIEVSERLREVSREDYVISRLGGDEFIVLVPVFENELEIEFLAEKLVAILCNPFKLRGNEYHLSASIGISMYPQNGEEINTLIKNAEMAMYFAKETGKNNYQFYNDEINKNIISKIEMENELRFAIERDQLVLYYQPQVDLQTGEVVGVEALVRWFHPTLGFVPPATFIPVAEETGLIIQIGDWILRKACFDLKDLQNHEWNSLTMSVNISMKQFLHSELVSSIQNALADSYIDPAYLKLEITESVAMSQPEQVITKLHELKKIGVDLALDDFGTGYSSLNYLKKLPVDVLKIDRAFIQEIVQDKDDMTIVKALIEVAHSLDMVVIAEGVETKEQQEILKSIQCDQLQGYYFSRPIPLDEIRDLLAGRQNNYEFR
ncbi:EAL domain-containing protein [Bacillus sp. DJP31]|uniref:EAL domain-containing protein n=1 Tax=Bacillus sp. DJP31 TaxID=3409789 RepID=UPI003BB80AE5